MRTILLLAFWGIVQKSGAPVATLAARGNLCAGNDTLFVTSPREMPSQIEWYNGGSLVGTVVPTFFPYGITVAGGNGAGPAANQLNFPIGAYVDDNGNVYVSDQKNNRVEEWAPGATSGVIVAGSGAGLNEPGDVFIDGQGYLYVTDVGNNRVLRLPPGSTALTPGVTIAGGNGPGAGATQFRAPNSAFVDGAGNLYVSDPANQRVQKFPPGSTSATPGVTVAIDEFPNDVFVDASGDIYVSDDDGSVWKWPPGAAASAGILVAGGNGNGPAANQLNAPYGIYVDGSGNLYVTDQFNNRIQKFPPGSTSATPGVTVAGGNGYGSADNQLALPLGLWVDAYGDIYTSDDGSRVQKWQQAPIIDSSFIATVPGTYTAVVTYPDGTVTTNAVVVNPSLSPAVSINTPATTVCAGTTVTFTAMPTNGGSGPVYQWQVNGISVGGTGPVYSSSTLANSDIVTCQLTSDIACPTAATVLSNSLPMTVNTVLIPSVAISPPAKVCFGLPATFSAVPANGGPDPVYQWQVNGVNGGADSPTFTSDAFNTGDVVTCQLTSSASCVTAATAQAKSAPVTVYVPISPVIQIEASATAVCADDTVRFSATVSDGGVLPAYQWAVNGVAVGTNSPDFGSTQWQSGDVVSCQYTGNGGCGLAHSNVIPLMVYSLPTVVTGPAISLTEGQSVTLAPQVTGDVASYSWMPGAGLSDNAVADPVASPEKTTLYTLTVATAEGCKASGVQAVTVYGKLRIPNAFTPNGDGKNDVFYILGGPGGSSIRHFSIYNRWGQQVFQVQDAAPNDPAFGWNGYYKGAPAPTGAYVYVVTVDLGGGIEQQFQGTVLLIR